MKRIKWLAGTPSAAGLELDQLCGLMLVFDRDGVTVEQLATQPVAQTATQLRRMLGITQSQADNAAQVIASFLKRQLDTAANPPSESELEAFIQHRQLRLQPARILQQIYRVLVSDDVTLCSFSADPITDEVFDPVWLQLAIERVENLPPAA